ncbi:MAG: type II toxin-antitoxin system RelE/ParE family toxin [Crocinitomicaceae bacterium]
MKKGYSEIIWSPLAESQYIKIKDYLLRKFTQKEVNKLNNLLDQFHEIILKFPELYPQTEFRNNLFRAVLSRQVSVFYRIEKKTVQIVAIYDNRQNFESKLKE